MPAARNARPGERLLTRRSFLRGIGAFTAVSLTGAALSCGPLEDDERFGGIVGTPVPLPDQFPEVPYTPSVAIDRSIMRSFTLEQARAVDALTARIIPGDPDDPGAREAGVVTYIDNLLAFNQGYAEHYYAQPPYASVGDGGSEGQLSSEFNLGSQDELDRYGRQTRLSPLAIFQIGIASLNAFAREEHGSDFADLDEGQQDEIVSRLAADNPDIPTFTDPSAGLFFETVRQHTIEGFFGDPAYGGNQDFAGWRLIGYPGAQRAYTPGDMHEEGSGLQRRTQGILELHHFNPGAPDDDVILPVTGSDEEARRLLLEQICGPSADSGGLDADAEQG